MGRIIHIIIGNISDQELEVDSTPELMHNEDRVDQDQTVEDRSLQTRGHDLSGADGVSAVPGGSSVGVPDFTWKRAWTVVSFQGR